MLRIGRLRRGEIVAAACGGALLAFTFTLSHGDTDGRAAAAPVPSPLVVMTAVSGLALGYTQATRRAPALPVSLAVIATTLGFVTTLALLVRLVRGRARPPAVGAAAGLTVGAFLSMRDEDGWVPDADHPVERVDLPTPADDTGGSLTR